MTDKKCNLHKEIIKSACYDCKKELCVKCGAIRYQYKTYCSECAKKVGPKEATIEFLSAREELQKQMHFYTIFIITTTVIFFGVVIGGIFFGTKGQAPVSLMPWQGILGIVVFVFALIIHVLFVGTIRCPKCDCSLLNYIGENLSWLFSFRNCPNCGYSLRD